MNRLRELRLSKGWTQTQLGSLLNLKDSVISKYETERILLTADTIRSLTEIFNVTSDFLLGLSNQPKKTNEKKLSDFLNEDEIELISIFKKLPEKEKYKIIGKIEEKIESIDNDLQNPSIVKSMISQKNVG